MSQPYTSKKRANNLAAGLLLVGLAVIGYVEQWWPGILLAFGLAVALRQALLGRWYDAILLALVFAGSFASFFFQLSWMPVLFLVAGIYLIFRDVSESDDEEEEEEEIQKEIEEEENP